MSELTEQDLVRLQEEVAAIREQERWAQLQQDTEPGGFYGGGEEK